jgi:NADH-quinone oxidoreductase subunit E
LSKPAIEAVADMLGLSYIRALEVATFYFMFQLQPVGRIAHIQVCGTTSCMICGAEDLVAVCKEKIAPRAHELSADGNFSWEEVECLGSCSNAPMAQIGKDYYEDLTTARLSEIIDELAAGKVPLPGPQNGRYAAEPLSGLTSLEDFAADRAPHNASVQLAHDIGDTVKRIDGTEVPLLAPWRGANDNAAPKPGETSATPARDADEPAAVPAGKEPDLLKGPREGGADDLKRIKGVGPKLEAMLNGIGIYHYDQIASWTDEEVAWADESFVGFKGRVSRDGWVEQARRLAQGEAT